MESENVSFLISNKTLAVVLPYLFAEFILNEFAKCFKAILE